MSLILHQPHNRIKIKYPISINKNCVIEILTILTSLRTTFSCSCVGSKQQFSQPTASKQILSIWSNQHNYPKKTKLQTRKRRAKLTEAQSGWLAVMAAAVSAANSSSWLVVTPLQTPAQTFWDTRTGSQCSMLSPQLSFFNRAVILSKCTVS